METVIIRLYGKLDKPNDAKRCWHNMLEDKVVPDQMAYATIMHIALTQEDEDFCDELMSSMRKHRVRRDRSCTQPSLVSLRDKAMQ